VSSEFDVGRIDVERYELTEPQRYLFEVERRDFLKILGGGLVVAAALPALAQESGRAGRGRSEPADIAAWLHIDERGGITAYTGKTEIGQNIRTSLAQAVADELRVPLASVTMVMADTDLVPYDAGTFGSQSTPRMSRTLARAAATAREMLLDLAATRLQTDRARLKASEGRVTAPGGQSIAYAELTKGQKLTGVVAAEPAIMTPAAWVVRGAAPKKVNGRAFVTGAHQFTPDLTRPGMLLGRIVRPESVGATLVSVDDSRVRGVTGARVVRDGEFIGVVAPTERALREAALAVRAEWKPLAGQPSSDTIYEHLKKNSGAAAGRNIVPPHLAGDVARARAEAAKTFDASYRIPYIAHVPLEPRAAVAEWEGDRLTVWAGTQRPFGVRAELASAFRISEDRVRVIVPDTGSAYGGKHTGEHAIEAARLAKAVERPVKLVWTRADEFSSAYFRPAGVIDIRATVDSGGRITAWEFDNWNSGAAAIRTPYDIPNQRITFHPSASPLRQGSYRGLAATANHYAREMHMDAMARALGVDAFDFRIRHLKDTRIAAVLQAAVVKAGWPKASAPGRALGLACGAEKGSVVATVAELSKTSDGFRVERLVVAFECGAVVNPDGLHNQIEGCIVQGLGGALFEHVEFRDGVIVNGSMEQYRVPRFKDVPAIEIVIPPHAKHQPPAGAGETPIVCVAPAIGSAARAFGEVATELPVRLA
jgi:isoquinoline 1-oxidoreductase